MFSTAPTVFSTAPTRSSHFHSQLTFYFIRLLSFPAMTTEGIG